MKIVILGDLHFGARKNSQYFLDYLIEVTDEIIQYCVDNGISNIIQLGDLFDSRKEINFFILNEIETRFFNKLRQNKIIFHSLIGNHDVFYKNTNKIANSKMTINEDEYIKIYDSITTLEFNGKQIDLIPWITQENEADTIDFINQTDSNICCGHFEITNWEFMKGIKTQHGIDANFFNNYDYVFSGHYHSQSYNKNIYYIGTPYQITWNDIHTKKRFIVYDTETNKFKNVNIDNEKFIVITQSKFDEYDLDKIVPNAHIRLEMDQDFKESTKLMYEINIRNPVSVELVYVSLNVFEELKKEKELAKQIEQSQNQNQSFNEMIFGVIDTIEMDDSINRNEIKNMIKGYIEG